MKKIIGILFVILIATIVLGNKHMNISLYKDNDIERINNEIKNDIHMRIPKATQNINSNVKNETIDNDNSNSNGNLGNVSNP